MNRGRDLQALADRQTLASRMASSSTCAFLARYLTSEVEPFQVFSAKHYGAQPDDIVNPAPVQRRVTTRSPGGARAEPLYLTGRDGAGCGYTMILRASVQ